MQEIKESAPRSRRAILAAAAGAAAATAATAMTRPLDAVADTGDPLILGQENTAADATFLGGRLLTNSFAANPTPDFLNPALGGHNGGTGAGQVGVYGSSFERIGVFGRATAPSVPQALASTAGTTRPWASASPLSQLPAMGLACSFKAG